MDKEIKCKYCGSAANNATTKKGLYTCCCYLLQNRDGTLTQYERCTQNVLFSKSSVKADDGTHWMSLPQPPKGE